MNQEVNVDYYVIDNKVYLVLKEVKSNGNTYVYLSNEMNPKDMMIRKLVGDSLYPIPEEEEIIKAFQLFFQN